ncbi:MAG TPA: formate/nitrite transporter family protein, partial [bacterium]|nr:formate/nitrite transporter family protein [bacterium]
MERLFLSPPEISRELARLGSNKAETRALDLFFLGILAGIYIGLGAHTALTVSSGGTLDAGLTRFLSGSVFSLGLILVLIPGAELFTGNILMTIGLLTRRYPAGKMLRNWLIVYAGNLAGSIFLAWLIKQTGLFGYGPEAYTPLGNLAISVAEKKMALTWAEAFSRGILCNMLVCLAVIMAISSLTVSGKILGIYFPIMAFVTCGYEHSIANMYFIPAGLLVQGQLLSNFGAMWKNLIPVTLGNIIGGLVLVLFHPRMLKRLFP